MEAALLTIGTEITSGEITNTNSVWLSERLEALGFPIVAQVSVPDNSKLIQWALDCMSQKSTLLVLTGGLGPTSDDITRQELASWCQKKLLFNDEAWADVNQRLNSRGVPVRESHKQQCYFQEGAELLSNHHGTAKGFYVQKDKLHIFVLPGPPRELEPMWETYVTPYLLKLPRSLDYGIRRWTLTNVPESEVAELVEEVMKGCSVVLGYRASKPTVRVKVKYQLSDAQALKRLEELDKRLKDLQLT